MITVEELSLPTDVYDITVEDNHNFYCDDILVHNCQEIALITSGYENVSELYSNSLDTDGEVALCFLASIVVTAFDIFSEQAEDIYYNACKFVDNTIERCEYPFPNIEQKSKARRNIGIGLTDVAHWMTKNGYKYDTEEGRNAIHRLTERHSYLLHKASVKLSRERGRCDWYNKTKYADGWLPIDTYNKEIDAHHTQELLQDWETLRKDVLEYGVRFSVHEAMMPVESSSVFTNSTNGLYPVRSLTMYKKSRKGPVYFSAPGADDYEYQYAWDINNLDLIKMYAIVQKFTGQSISSDVYVDYRKDSSPPISGFIKEILLAHKLGMKTFYYMNSNTDTGAHEEQQSQQDIEGCEECKL